MNRTRPYEDFEQSQILYDDMAYRQLRKDSDAYKLAQMKTFPVCGGFNTPSTIIATLLAGYERISSTYSWNYSYVKTVKWIKQKDTTNKNYRQSLINNNNDNNNTALQLIRIDYVNGYKFCKLFFSSFF